MAKKVKKKTSTKAAVKKTVKKKAVKRAVSKRVTKKTAKKTTAKAASKKTKTVKAKRASAKKATANKTSKKTKRLRARKRPTSNLSSKDLNHFRALLVEKLKEILGSVNQIETEALKTSRLDSTGDLSSMPIHMADLGSDNYEQEFALGLMDSERKIVQEIYEALKRIQNRTYGICEGTGEPIPKMRLEGIPWTRYCVKYAEMLEKGLVVEPNRDYFEDNDYEEGEDLDFSPLEDYEEGEDEEDTDVFFYGYDDEDDEEEEGL